jgi:hypothetical protein
MLAGAAPDALRDEAKESTSLGPAVATVFARTATQDEKSRKSRL